MKDKRMMKKPKYKIGDIIVYQERYDNDEMVKIYQSEIIESYSYLTKEDEDDVLGWFYHTKETLSSQSDSLTEDKILYKLK